MPPDTRKVLKRDTSRFDVPAPRTMLRPALPKRPASVSGFNRRNAERLIQVSTVRGPSLGFATASGRLAKNPDTGGWLPCNDTLVLSYTVNGVPELTVA